MFGYQPWRCLKHNLIADLVRKPRWFLKIVWENFLVNNLLFVCVRIVKGPKSNIFTCKLCAWVIFIILFTGLLCDNSNSLTYEPRKGQSPTLSRANCVILHLILAFHIKIFNIFVCNFSRDFLRDRLYRKFKKGVLGLLGHVTSSLFFRRIFRSEVLVYNSYFFQNSRSTKIIRH